LSLYYKDMIFEPKNFDPS